MTLFKRITLESIHHHLSNNELKQYDMLDKIKEVSKKVRQAKFKSVTEGITMSDALKEIFKEN